MGINSSEIQKDSFANNYGVISSTCFKGFRAIPFVYEIKMAIDWGRLSTSLDIFQWIKLDEIFSKLYCAKIDALYFEKEPFGIPVKKIYKVFCGGSCLAMLLLILLGPIIFFSSLNPITKENLVVGASFKLGISINKTSYYYDIYSNSYISDIRPLSPSDWEKNNFSRANSIKNFDRNSVRVKNPIMPHFLIYSYNRQLSFSPMENPIGKFQHQATTI